ncbi:MAG: hypothetical protein WCC30_04635 [Candidatus Dormiibacterota bacterium]
MDETRFRSLMHEAIGDQPMQPRLPAAVRTRLTEPRPRAVPGTLALLAAVLLTVLVVAALVGPRLLGHVPPAGTSTPVLGGVDPSNCTLPVYVGSEVGFVDTHTERYTKDVSASVVALPSSFASRPMYYSSALKRWLPVSVSYMSPDGRSYAWIRLLPDGSTQANFKTAELHRYEVATGTDQLLWTTTVFFIVWRWDAAGILVSVPPSGSNLAPANWWLVDPVTGAATQQVSSSHASLYSFTPLAGDPTDISFSSVGVNAEGHPIWWLFTNGKAGGVNWVFYETAPGQRVFIYRGSKDDASALDPLAAMADSTGIWFSDYRDPNVIRHWQQGTGLRNVMVTGLPAVDQGTFPGAIPAGPCF